MSEKDLKDMVTEINNLNKTNYNVLQFTSLDTNGLLQIMADVFFTLELIPAKMIVVRNPEESMMQLIRVIIDLKVPLPVNNVQQFTDGIFKGDKSMLYPELNWILANQEEVQKRAYFVRYLKKVLPPTEIKMDDEIQEHFALYEKTINDFKSFYSEAEKLKKEAAQVIELRKNLLITDKDVKQITELANKQKIKLSVMPKSNELVHDITSTLQETKRNKDIIEAQEAIDQERNALNGKLFQIKDQIEKMSSLQISKRGALQTLKEEVQNKEDLIKDELGKNLNFYQFKENILDKIIVQPDPDDDFLEEFSKKIDEKDAEVIEMSKQRAIEINPQEDKLAQYRVQATIIANNKKALTDAINEMKDELKVVHEQMEDKENELQRYLGIAGGIMPHGDKLRVFVKDLRQQALIYKQKKAQLQELQAESGIQDRTQEILSLIDPTLTATLKNNSYSNIKEETPQDIHEMRKIFKDTQRTTNVKKANVATMKQKLKAAQDKLEGIKNLYQFSKENFDTITFSLREEDETLEKEVDRLTKEIENGEKTWKDLKREVDFKESLRKSLDLDRDNNDSEHETQKESLMNKMAELAKIRQSIMEKTKIDEVTKQETEEQIQLWHHVTKVCKSIYDIMN